MTTTTPTPRRRTPIWAVVLLIVLVGGVAAIAGIALGMLFGPQQTATRSEVVKYVLPQQKVALASLRIEGVERVKKDGEIFGIPVDAADRMKYLIYSFDANVGLDGARVRVDQTGDHTYLASVPAFDFLSHSNIHFEDPIDDDGLLAFLTDEISQSEMTNRILSDENKAEYVTSSIDTLKSQTEAFYGGIVTSVDPDADLTFEFAK
ncbi:hypothetical protein GCM10009775_12890 [Microbacterium aoyamense]|uniref:DUF4230 domain-containing protein n=2 Tax=Microbacterium aoyamense TaxID=344166 RepID=A0ABP5ASY8_9MICO